MKLLHKNPFFLSAGAFIILSALFFLTRILFLKNLPIFVDEATHIHWAQLGFVDPSQRMVSLGDGKQPLFIWLIIFMMHFFTNPLIAGRAASILSGFGASVGMFFLTYELFKKKSVAFFSMFFYILCPFPLIMDRITIFDSLVTLTALWSLYFSIHLVRKIELRNSFLLAFALGAGLLTKSTGFLAIYTLPFSLFLFPKTAKPIKTLGKWIMYTVLAVGISYLYFSVLRLSPDFANISAKNSFFLNSPLWLFQFTFFPLFLSNVATFANWIWFLFTPSFLILTAVSLVKFRDFMKEKALLLAVFLFEIIGLALLVKYPNPRYIFFMTMFLIPLASMGFWYMYDFCQKKLPLFVFLVVCLLFYPVYADYQILTNLEYAPVPSITKVELATGWPAGEGMSQIVKYLLTQSQQRKIFVVTDGIYGGATPAVMDVYFFQNNAVDRMSIDKFSNQNIVEILSKKQNEPVYLFLNRLRPLPALHAQVLLKYYKGHSKNYVALYIVK